jgi:uncharacterized damage-inducible protein DinB
VARSTSTAGSTRALSSALLTLFERELAAVRREVDAYARDDQLWQSVPGTSNVGGTLVLHLAGNLQHFLGARLGRTGYVRNRDAEFSRRGVSRPELIAEIHAAGAAVKAGFATLTDAQLLDDYPEIIAGRTVTIGQYLMHLSTHLAFHLGQIDYHRRVVTGSNEGVGAVRTSELSFAHPLDPARSV